MVMPWGCEGNRGFGVALVTHQRFVCGLSIYGAHGLRTGDENPAYIPVAIGAGTLYLYIG